MTLILAIFFWPKSTLTWLHTDGRNIKNEHGKTVYLRGVAIVEPNTAVLGVSSYWGQEDGTVRDLPGYLPNSFNLLRECGVNMMRIAVSPFSWMGVDRVVDGLNVNYVGQRPGDARYIQTTEEYRQNLDMLISELAKRNIYSFIDCHCMGLIERSWWQDFVDNYLTQYQDFLRQIAQRYIDQPAMMGIQLVNEPRRFYNDYPYEGYWWDFCLEAARKIHEVNPNLLVLVASTDRTVNGTTVPGGMSDAGYQCVSDQFTLNPLPEPNIVYVFHSHFGSTPQPTYDFWNNYAEGNNELARQQFEDFLYLTKFRAIAEYNLPVMNSEFSVRHYDNNRNENPFDYLVVARDYMELMNKYGCAWTWWPWGGSVGYPWDHSPESGSLVYMSGDLPVWDRLSYLGEVWKEQLTAPFAGKMAP